MILSVLKKDRNFVYVNCDEIEYLKIPYSVWEKFHLYDKVLLEHKDFELIVAEIEFNSAKFTALRLLAKRAYFKNELLRKLIQLKFSKNSAESVISSLSDLGFLDDEKNIENFISEKLKIRRYGLNRIKNLLKLKGVERELIESSIKKNSNENSQNILENIHILALKKIKSLLNKNLNKNKIYQKMYSHLILKGYAHDIVAKELKNLLGKDEFDN